MLRRKQPLPTHLARLEGTQEEKPAASSARGPAATDSPAGCSSSKTQRQGQDLTFI